MTSPASADVALTTIVRLLEVAIARPDHRPALLSVADELLTEARGKKAAVPAEDAQQPRRRRRTKTATSRKSERHKPQSKAAAAPPAEPVTHNGVTVEGNVIRFNGKSITVRPKEAAVAVELARVMPDLLDDKQLAKNVWGRTDDLSLVLARQTTTGLSQATDAIGLKVTRTRGIGSNMAAA